MRARLVDAAVIVLSLCAVITTGLVVRRELFAPRPQAPGPAEIREWREYAREGHRIGEPGAPVTIVVFSDFQCPFCSVLMERVRAVQAARPREVAVVYRHWPLPNHPHALSAARASDCAAEQGKFPAFHDALFAKQDSIGVIPWEQFAVAAGVGDLTRFRACASATGALASVARDTMAGRRLPVSGTPTLLVNDLRFYGAVPKDTLDAYVRRALAARPGARS